MNALELEVESWLSAAKHMQTRSTEEAMAQLERVESTISSANRAFLTSCHKCTDGDKALAEAIAARTELLEKVKSGDLPHVARWLSCCLGMLGKKDAASRVVQFAPTLFPIPGAVGSSSSTDAKASEKGAGSQQKSEKQDTTKEEKKSKEAPAPAPTPAAVDDLDPSKLDLRVGMIKKCWNHPDSEKLLCEEIDVGEENVRSVASGLRLHYKAEEMEGRKVIVVCNLKDAKMGGFKSQGMVLCACNGDHSVIKLLEAGEAAVVGERVIFKGYSGEPAAPSAMAKKKLLEKLAPGLKTNDKGEAQWGDGGLFTLTTGVVTAPLTNATVS